MTSLPASSAPPVPTSPRNRPTGFRRSAALSPIAANEPPLPSPADDLDPSIAPSPQDGVDLVWAVDHLYALLYKFGFSLSGDVSDAADLTQETYRVLFAKGGEIRDPAKVKHWLFTTLYRLFLRRRRRAARFPETSLESGTSDWNLPTLEPARGERFDSTTVVAALQRLDEKFRTPLVMFYLQELSYKEMASALKVPIGTIMSRLFRGKELLRKEFQGHCLLPSDLRSKASTAVAPI